MPLSLSTDDGVTPLITPMAIADRRGFLFVTLSALYCFKCLMGAPGLEPGTDDEVHWPIGQRLDRLLVVGSGRVVGAIEFCFRIKDMPHLGPGPFAMMLETTQAKPPDILRTQ